LQKQGCFTHTLCSFNPDQPFLPYDGRDHAAGKIDWDVSDDLILFFDQFFHNVVQDKHFFNNNALWF
jgi:hypothetical protein